LTENLAIEGKRKTKLKSCATAWTFLLILFLSGYAKYHSQRDTISVPRFFYVRIVKFGTKRQDLRSRKTKEQEKSII